MKTYQEGASMRGIQSAFGLARTTLASWVDRLADCLATDDETRDKPRPRDVSESDELWPSVYSKNNKRWVWIVLCRAAIQIVAYYVGNWSAESDKKCGAECHSGIENAKASEIIGKFLKRLFPTILPLERNLDKQITLNVGIIL